MLLRLCCLALLCCLAGCAAPRLMLAEHPLAGRVWDVAGQRFISPAEAEARIAEADMALLGEIHDNLAHHQVQTQLMKGLAARGRKPALAMEQFDSEWQAALDQTAAAKGATPADLARAGHLSPGWEWSLYRPLVLLALREKLPIVAANLSRPRARQVASGGLAALGEGEAERLGLQQAWTARQHETLRRLLVEGHCGQDSPMIDRLVTVQRSRDATMADRMLAASQGAVAILGRSHARHDIGVPLYLRQRAPALRILSVGLLEVAADGLEPAAYADAAPGLHDLVWFTPRARRPDPCGAGVRLPGNG